MVSPLEALAWFAGLLVVVAVVVWPRRGLVAWLVRFRRTTERVRIEDALKHLVNCELSERPASVASLAGMLEISTGKAHTLIARLAALDLARSEPAGIVLTESGRAYALRILRTHRLLERYYADRTGASPADWHDLAETAEHVLSEDDVEALAARMGHPVYDPHGDPIPTASGTLPPNEGIPLMTLEPGQTGTVVHVEDEPASVYRELHSLGIDVAVPITLVGSEPNRIEILVAGEPRQIDPLMASAVSVVHRATDDAQSHFERLDTLRPGEAAEVIQIAAAVQGPQRRRLLDLGLLPGTAVTAELRSASGDPTAYRIRGALIALRRAQARAVFIRRASEPAR